jgi:N-acetylmuramoyl-L-alanine amidase
MEVGVYCPATEGAVRAFQVARGLRADGICDEYTWVMLVEATWKLGDRMLFLTSPNLRGDDVIDLQSMLTRLGFDCGRVDGILGPRTSRALVDFQSNCGLLGDGVCGPSTVKTLRSVSSQSGSGPGVSTLRETERLRMGFESMGNCRIVVGQFGGLSSLVRAVAYALRHHGASVMTLDEPDAVAQALAANHFEAHVFIGFESAAEPTATATFYQVPSFHSVGGKALADSLVTHLASVADASGVAPTSQGMRLSVLRETRMPAVLLTLGPPRLVTDATPSLVRAIYDALEEWIVRTP